jgi:hypothetical protein
MLILINILLSLITFESFAGHDFYSELSTFHAPFVIQEYGRTPKADVFTRVDFDGDFNAANNWRNLPLVEETKPFVYFSVQETELYWYLNYGFFYPRDYAPICFWEICHENDFEGIRLTVKKDETVMGKVILMESFAHGKIKYDEDLSIHPSRNQVMIFIERGGHAVRSFKNRSLPGHFKEYSSDDYSLIPLEELWNLRTMVGPESLWKDTYDYQGVRFRVTGVPTAFEGRKWGHGLSNPPWAWTGGGKEAKRGDWFFDPITSLCSGFKCMDEAQTQYIYNPFLPL